MYRIAMIYISQVPVTYGHKALLWKTFDVCGLRPDIEKIVLLTSVKVFVIVNTIFFKRKSFVLKLIHLSFRVVNIYLKKM